MRYEVPGEVLRSLDSLSRDADLRNSVSLRLVVQILQNFVLFQKRLSDDVVRNASRYLLLEYFVYGDKEHVGRFHGSDFDVDSVKVFVVV